MKHLVALTIVLAGCNSILGVGDFTTDPSNVTGTSTISYIVFDGTLQEAPEDLSKYTIKAYIPDGAGNFEIHDGAGAADGTFTIPGVPLGTTYYLYLLYPQIPNHAAPTPRFFETNARTIDLGYYVSGRADAVEATKTSTVSFDLTNVTAWADGDILLLDSYNNGSEFSDIGLVTNPPSNGATSITGYAFDWRNGYTYHPVGSLPRLIDAAKGDDFYVTQLHNDVVNTGTWTYALSRQVGVLVKHDVTQVDGSPVVISGALAPITFDKTISIHFATTTFRNHFAPDGGRAAFETLSLGRLDNAGAQYNERIGSGPWSFTIPPSQLFLARVPTDVTISIPYGSSSLFPAAWGQNAYGQYTRRRRFRAPGAMSNTTLAAFSSLTRPLSGAAFELQPVIRPVMKIEVDHIDVLKDAGRIAFDGTVGPTVTWDAVPLADGYTVDVQRIYNDAGMTQKAFVLTALTTTTSFTIPPDALMKGQRYSIGVTTRVGLDDTGLRRVRVPEGDARVWSNAFLYSSSCGDGVTQPDLGEECDEGGQTATCDSDCTKVLCGDANTNTAAGEMCDFGGSALGCDFNCSPVACGDGVYNNVAEYCDDGNTDDTDGCTTTCERSGTCGDGTVQTSVEECDPPNGTTCSYECYNM